MKRSEVSTCIDQALSFFDSFGFPLPELARWTPEEWVFISRERELKNNNPAIQLICTVSLIKNNKK